MFGFVGIYNSNLREVRETEIKTMFKEVKDTSCFQYFIDSNFGVGVQLPEKNNPVLSVPSITIDSKKSTAVIFEGRISNIQNLQDKFLNKRQKKNLIYKSQGEIILDLYKLYGTKFFSEIKGAFACLIWDKNINQVILCRDKIGIKPLYYYSVGDKIIFGTHLNSIFRNSDVKKEIDLERLYSYFFVKNLTSASQTIFKNLYNLSPASILILNKKSKKLEKYWSIKKWPVISVDKIDEDNLINTLYGIVEKSVLNGASINNLSPIAFSGGLDSSILLAFSKKNKIPIKTFTVDYKSKDKMKKLEYKMSRQKAKKFNIEQSILHLSPEKFLYDFNELVRSFDLLTLTSLGNFYICKWIAESSDIVMSGDGVEEQMSGYRNHFFADFVELPQRLFSIYNDKSFLRIMKKYYCSYTYSHHENRENRKLFFSKEVENEIEKYRVFKIFNQCFKKADFSTDFLSKVLWVDFHNDFCINMLTMLDTVSRTYSLEICLPFLDIDFIEFSFNLHSSFKMRKFSDKYIFRRMAAELFGKKNVVQDFKAGSNIPINEWLLNPIFEKYVKNILKPSRVKRNHILNEEFVKQLVKNYYQNKGFCKGINSSWRIWQLIIFQLWWENHFG